MGASGGGSMTLVVSTVGAVVSGAFPGFKGVYVVGTIAEGGAVGGVVGGVG